MSILGEISQAIHSLSDMQLREKKRRQEEGDHTETISGVEVTWRPFYADRKQSRHEVILDGYNFACEIEYTPWSVFKPITVHYWVWLDLSLWQVEDLIARVREPEGELTPMGEFYPTANGPVRYNACARELGDVLKLWKLWREDYRPK